MGHDRHPVLYEINTRLWLAELAREEGHPVALDQVPDGALDRIAGLGLDWVWLLGAWQTGAAGRQVSLAQSNWQADFRRLLPDLRDEDVSGSPFAIQAYTVHRDFGGDAALARFRQRLRDRGIRLMLDYVPNHTALDHPWVAVHPEFYIHASESDLAREPANYVRLETPRGPEVLAYGRDPYFPGWPDTLQLNYRHPALREAMIGELVQVAGRCDGVRCDMAMLVLPDVFAQTWGAVSLPRDGVRPVDDPFWPEALARVRAAHRAFLLMAEAYWDREETLQQQGFDFTYDKRLYDRLRDRNTEAVLGHLHADPGFQDRSARFLENHDEERAAATFPTEVERAVAIVTFLVPGLRLFHEGQLEGRTSRASVHLARRPDEPVNASLRAFYLRLLGCLQRPEPHEGRWQLRECRPAWDGNATWRRFIVFTWEGPSEGRLLIAVNYGPTQGQCQVPLPMPVLQGRTFVLRDLLSSASYTREGDDLAARGLYLDMPAWGYHVFEWDEGSHP